MTEVKPPDGKSASKAETKRPDADATNKPVAAESPAAEAVKKVAPLLSSEIWARESGVKFNTWEVCPLAGTPPEALLTPEFWGNVSAKMKLGDTILALPRDGAWYGEFLVWDAGQNWAHVSGKGHAVRPEFGPVPGVNSDFIIGNDPVDGVVVRRKDGTKVRGNFTNHEDARRWIMDHQRALRK